MLALKVRVRRNGDETRLSVDEVEEIQEFLKSHERSDGMRVVMKEGANPTELRSVLVPVDEVATKSRGEKAGRSGFLELVLNLVDGRQVTFRGRAALGSVTAAQELLRRMPGIVQVEEL